MGSQGTWPCCGFDCKMDISSCFVAKVWLLVVCEDESSLPTKTILKNPAVDGSEIRQSPVEVGSLSHYLQRFLASQVVSRISAIKGILTNTNPIDGVSHIVS